MTLQAGARLDHYEVRALVGRGGMGEVYLAEDVNLRRRVALKVLLPEVAGDADRLARFLQEARAASQIGGAHAAHIYEIKQADGLHFIAMEYVEGESLDRRLGGRPLDVEEAVRVGIQIAEALEEAHARGVVHRDIKPANIIITPAGQVKVLDFGLAKMNEREGRSLPPGPETDPGLVMGTVSYMSPEQALGERDVDHRTDIFSLGVVLYEMVTGRVPFAGDSAGQTIDRIVHTQPDAIAHFNYGVPVELDVIVRKALRKRRDERYQSVRDLLNDLRELKRDLDYARHERSLAPETRGGAAGGGSLYTSGSEQPTVMLPREQSARTSREPAARTNSLRPARTATVTPPARTTRQARGRPSLMAVAVAALVLLCAVAGATYSVYRIVRRGEPAAGGGARAGEMRIARLTNTGRAANAAISPDGKLVVHVVADGERQSLWLRQTAVQSDVEIVAPAEVKYTGLTFSNDGNFVYYVAGERNAEFGVLYRVPALGGAPAELVRDVDSAVTFSPDGRQLAFMRGYPNRGESALIVADADGRNERPLAVRKESSFFWGAPAWSPDGQWLAAPAAVRAGGAEFELVGVPVAGGAERLLTQKRWGDVRGLQWFDGGRGLVVSATEQPGGAHQIWQVSAPSGEVRRVTNDLNRYLGVSLTADAGALVTIQSERRANVWVAPGADAGRARQVTSGASRDDGVAGLAWAPDGRVVFASRAGGDWGIWIINADGSGQKQLTGGEGRSVYPAVTPDGRYVFYDHARQGTSHIWRVDLDGGGARQMTDGAGEFGPRVSPDGRWLFYQSTDEGQWSLWKMPVEGGRPVLVRERVMGMPALSPDGKWLAYGLWDERAQAFKYAVAPADGGEPLRTLERLPLSGVVWTPDGRALAYVDTRGGASNVWAQPVGGGPARPLTNFQPGDAADTVFTFAFSPDGRQLAVTRGQVTRDVVLIKDFR